MPFFVFKLLVAVVAIALLLAVVLIVRRLRRKRLAKAAGVSGQPESESELAKPRVFGSAVRTPDPGPTAPAAAARRRQLRSLSEIERSAAEEAAEPAAAETAATQEGDLSDTVLAWLETAFERLEAGEITLAAYTEQLAAEQARIDERIAELRAAGDAAQLSQALAAQESLRWCLDWAANLAEQQEPR